MTQEASVSESGSVPYSTSTQKSVTEQLHENILEGDLLVSLFWSAMNSFRHDSILRPFPPMFVESGSDGGSGGGSGGGGGGGGDGEGEGTKDMDGLHQVFDSLPSLDKIASGQVSLSTQQTQLLQWILNPRKFSVCSRNPSSFSSLIQNTSSNKKQPKYIFELKYCEEAESKFASTTGDYEIMHAFHGSSVENFHSILHNGLLNIFNKMSAFGEGTYLSTELGVCLNWSPSGPLWPGSALTHAASCIAMCEVVKHPSVMSREQIGGEPNLQQKVPDTYFVVTNDEFIRVKYIFIFEMQKPIVKSRSWIYQHKFLIVLAIYLIFLSCIGVTQSRHFKRFLRKHYNNYLSS